MTPTLCMYICNILTETLHARCTQDCIHEYSCTKLTEKSRLRRLGRLNGLGLHHSGGEEQEDDDTADQLVKLSGRHADDFAMLRSPQQGRDGCL